jgi:Tfp pilus assembly protein PilZ
MVVLAQEQQQYQQQEAVVFVAEILTSPGKLPEPMAAAKKNRIQPARAKPAASAYAGIGMPEERRHIGIILHDNI